MANADELFHGALYVEDGYPCRLPESVRKWYYTLGPEFSARADCTAGIRLSFQTDCQTLEFSFEVQAFCRSCNVADIYENGVHVGSVRLPDMQTRCVLRFQRRDDRRARIDVWLPNTCGLRLRDCRLGDWQPVERQKKGLLLLGDSILQGIASHFPTCSLGNQLLLGAGEGINQSVGGACFFPETIEPLAWFPSGILVALGANDAFAEEAAWQERIPAYFEKLRGLYPDIPIVAVTPIWNARLAENDALRDAFASVSEAISRAGSERGAHIVDGMPLVGHAAAFFNEDGVHPNDLGFMQYAMRLHGAVEPLLAKP